MKNGNAVILLITLLLFTIMTFGGSNEDISVLDASREVWNVVKAHNIAWAELEDVNQQLKYVHEDVVSISPPFKEISNGKKKRNQENMNMQENIFGEFTLTILRGIQIGQIQTWISFLEEGLI